MKICSDFGLKIQLNVLMRIETNIDLKLRDIADQYMKCLISKSVSYKTNIWFQMRSTHLLGLSLLVIITCVPIRAQFVRPISIPGIFSMIRFQNTACTGDNEEGGTCLYEGLYRNPIYF